MTYGVGSDRIPAANRYPVRRVIAVDVDGTLIRAGAVNLDLVGWCRAQHAAGFQLIVWSANGEQHAREATRLAGMEDVVAHAISKPGIVLDDRLWDWTRDTLAVRGAPVLPSRATGG